MEHDVLSMLLVGAGLFVIAGIVRNLLSRRLTPASISKPSGHPR